MYSTIVLILIKHDIKNLKTLFNIYVNMAFFMLGFFCILQQERSSVDSYKTVTVISQEDFKKMAPPEPKIQNPEVPPPPPPVVSHSSIINKILAFIITCFVSHLVLD